MTNLLDKIITALMGPMDVIDPVLQATIKDGFTGSNQISAHFSH